MASELTVSFTRSSKQNFLGPAFINLNPFNRNNKLQALADKL